MDTLHHVLRSIRGKTPRRDHLRVFREFLGHLDRIGKGQRTRSVKSARTGLRRAK